MLTEQKAQILSYLSTRLTSSNEELHKKDYLDEKYIEVKVNHFINYPQQNLESYYDICQKKPLSAQSINNIIALSISNIDPEPYKKITIAEDAFLVISIILGNRDMVRNYIKHHSLTIEYILHLAAENNLKNIFTLLADIEPAKLTSSLMENIKKAFSNKRAYLVRFYIENTPILAKDAIQLLLSDYYQLEQNFTCLIWIAIHCESINPIKELELNDSKLLIAGIIRNIEAAYQDKESHSLKCLEKIAPKLMKEAIQTLFAKNEDGNLDFILWIAMNLGDTEILKKMNASKLKQFLNRNMASVLSTIMQAGQANILEYIETIAKDKIQANLSYQQVNEAIFHFNLALLDYLTKQYPSFMEQVKIETKTAFKDLDSLKQTKDNKVEKLSLHLATIQEKQEISNITIQAIIHATNAFLKQWISRDEYLEVAQYAGEHINSNLSVLMMALITNTQIDTNFHIPLELELFRLKNYTAKSSKELNKKKNKLVEYIENLDKEGKTPKTELLAIVDATYSLLTNKKDMTPQKYKELAKGAEGHANPLMKTIGILMMTIGALAIIVGLVLASTGMGVPLGVGINAGGFTLGLIGYGFFAESKEHGLARKITEISELKQGCC